MSKCTKCGADHIRLAIPERIRKSLGAAGLVLPARVIDDIQQTMLHRVHADPYYLENGRFAAAVSEALEMMV